MDQLTRTSGIGELIELEKRFDQSARIQGNDHSYSLALVDITELRNINLRYGSAFGDQVLIEVANRLRNLCPNDCIARVGGDKFAVLIEKYDHHEVSQLKRRIRSAINSAPHKISEQLIPIHVRVTIRTGPQVEFDESNLLWRAQRDAQVELIRDFEQRLDALERYALKTMLTDRADLQTRLSKMEQLSQQDPLTGLLNRRGYENLRSSLSVPYALAFIDIDNLRDINSSQGGNWAAGDRALRSVSRLLEGISVVGVAVRWGGDEFLLLLPGMDSDTACERLNSVLEQSGVQLRAGDLLVTFSGGVASVNSDSSHPSAMAKAQQAAQQAKRTGRSRILNGDLIDE